MPSDSLSAIVFDEQDANLFQVDDARLRADALKHSVLPRLRVVLNEAIAQIREVYGIEALEDSIVSEYPNFRTKRANELKFMYDNAFVGLGGKRKALWSGFARKDGKPVQILPFRFALCLEESSLFIVLENGWLTGLANQSFERILRFHLDYEAKINTLCFASGMYPTPILTDCTPFVCTFSEQYQARIDNGWFDNCFFGRDYYFPVREPQLRDLVKSFSSFFPVYDSYICMAKGEQHRFDELFSKLNDYLEAQFEVEDENTKTRKNTSANEQAAALAQQKVRVMPALRWQVFQRDGWKCVACGKGAHDDVILHVDHIQPRSLGGSDSLGNFQTLCDQCNLGKSNRDNTDLRKGSHGLDH